jgi:hypothetical protein
MSAHDFLLIAPQSRINFGPENISDACSVAKSRRKRKVPVRSAKEVPALANVRALVSPAQLNILRGSSPRQREKSSSRREEHKA